MLEDQHPDDGSLLSGPRDERLSDDQLRSHLPQQLCCRLIHHHPLHPFYVASGLSASLFHWRFLWISATGGSLKSHFSPLVLRMFMSMLMSIEVG